MTAVGPRRIPLRQQRDLGQIIEASFNLYFQNFWPLFKIAAVVIPLGVASGALQSSLEDEVTLIIIITTVISFSQAAVGLLAAAALITAYTDIDSGRPPDFTHAYDVAFARFWSLLGAILRVLFHVILLFITILGIPWAIQRSVRWLFVEQAVIMDSTSAKAALSYSADAVNGRWWRTLGIWIVIAIIGGVPGGIVSGIFSLAPPLIAGSASAVVNALLLPFAVAAATLLYMDLKVRKESDVIDGTA